MEKPNRDLQIHTRMVLLSEVEQEAFEQVRPFWGEIDVDNGVRLRMDGGEAIADEWESEWAEGERYWM
jgi:hypothetical protein